MVVYLPITLATMAVGAAVGWLAWRLSRRD